MEKRGSRQNDKRSDMWSVRILGNCFLTKLCSMHLPDQAVGRDTLKLCLASIAVLRQPRLPQVAQTD